MSVEQPRPDVDRTGRISVILVQLFPAIQNGRRNRLIASHAQGRTNCFSRRQGGPPCTVQVQQLHPQLSLYRL